MKAEVSMQLRLPKEIRDALAADAANNHRSMNGHMIAILTERFRSLGLLPDSKAPSKCATRR